MSTHRIAAAQSHSIACDLDANLAHHLDIVDAAHAAGVTLLLFPELSLCGYELAALADCALAPNDARLAPLHARAMAANMTLIVGAPLVNAHGAPHIGVITLFADGRIARYAKHFLHGGETEHAAPGPALTQVHMAHGLTFGLAICFDSAHARHAQAASAGGAELYLASSLISEGGYAKDAALLAGHAASCGMVVLMANHASPSGGYASAGKSACWAPNGQLVVAAPGPGEALVIAERIDGAWRGQVLALPN